MNVSQRLTASTKKRIAALLVPGATPAISHLIAPDDYEW
jgi:hypothetical protein